MSDALMSRRREGGVGMVEVLAALFVLSVGLLGIAGLQAQGIRAGHSATLRSLAVIKSVEIIERMRANPDGIRDTVPNDSAYNVSFTGAGLDGQCDDTDAAGEANDCTVANLASHDIFWWKQSLTAAFANMNAVGSINTTFGGAAWNAPSTTIVQVQWTERGVVQNYTTQVQFVRACPTTPC